MTLDTRCVKYGKFIGMAVVQSDTPISRSEAIRLVKECPVSERHGIHTRVSRMAGVARYTLYRWLREEDKASSDATAEAS